MAKVTLTLDHAAINVVVGGQARDAAQKAARSTERRVRENITSSGRVNTGKMRDSITTQATPSSPLNPSFTIYSALDYTLYQEKGTRPHGPTSSKFMVFQPKGSQAVVFAKWVQGVTPARFFEKALNSVSVSDFAT